MACLLLLTTHTKAFTAAYNPSTSLAMAIRPSRVYVPPTFCSILATGRGQKVLTPGEEIRYSTVTHLFLENDKGSILQQLQKSISVSYTYWLCADANIYTVDFYSLPIGFLLTAVFTPRVFILLVMIYRQRVAKSFTDLKKF